MEGSQTEASVVTAGFLVDFISYPVRSGFTSATAILVATSQLKGLLGLQYRSHGLVDNLRHVVTQANEIRLWDTMLGVGCIVFLLSFRVTLYSTLLLLFTLLLT